MRYKLKDNAKYEGQEEIYISDSADTGIIKDQKIIVSKKATKQSEELKHKCRSIAYWDDRKEKLLVFLTNSNDLSAE